MYCPECRQERLGASSHCALCGTAMSARTRMEVETELAHVHFLLSEMSRWETSEVPPHVRRFLSERYERQARILLSVLAESKSHAPAVPWEHAAVAQATPVVPEAVVREELPAASVEEVALPDEHPAVVLAETPLEQAAASEVPAVGAAAEVASVVSREEAAHEAAMFLAGEAREPVSEAREPEAHPLPENPLEPLFEAPPPPSHATARLVEKVSTWSRVWKPFLAETLWWFIGAILILSSTLYLVFESWAGISSNTRSLIVFGMTAGVSAGFSLMGRYLAKREALRDSGNILGLIGSASAPLVGIALGPIGLGEASLLEGVGLALRIPLLFAWALGAAWLVRKPAEAFDAPSRPFVQLGLISTTLMMGLAPLAVKLGDIAPWLNVLPCVLFFLLSRKAVDEPREGTTLVFALGAPLYLLVAYAVRLHVALEGAGASPGWSLYAPLVAFLLACALRFRTLPPEKAVDPLALWVASLQLMCLLTTVGARGPMFFVTAAIITWTMVSLARGALNRLPWVYPAYAASYFAYATMGQLVPGPVKALIASFKAAMGYATDVKLPVQYGALTALPFVLAGVVFAVSRLWRGERTSDARDVAFAEVLFRSTAVAGVLFSFYGMAGPDSRPALWCVLGLSLVCLFAGLLVERFYLTLVGAFLAPLVPLLALNALFGSASALISGVLALVLAGVCTVCTARTRKVLAPVTLVVGSLGFFTGLSATLNFMSIPGMVLCGASALVVAWTLRNESVMAYAAWLMALLVPKVMFQASETVGVFSLVLVALGLAVASERSPLLRKLGLPALFFALFGFVVGIVEQVSGLGMVMLLAAASVAWASRLLPRVRPLAVVLAAFALLPDLPSLSVQWGGLMLPGMSLALFILWGLGSSVAAARWGRSASTTTAALVTWVFPLVAVKATSASWESLYLAGSALAVLLTARALPAGLSLAVSALYATAGLYTVGPVALLGLAAVFALLAVAEEIPSVLAIGAGGRRFAWVATVSSGLVLLLSVLSWDDAHPAWMVSGAMVLPLLWTRANRLPYLAALSGPYVFVGLLAIGGASPAWLYVFPLVALAVARAVEHVPAFSSLLLRSREVSARNALSLGMQVSLAFITPLVMLRPWVAPEVLYVLAGSLALMPGPRPSLRVCGAALLLLFVPEARPVVTGLLLALALAEHHVPSAVWAFFRSPPDVRFRWGAVLTALVIAVLPVADEPSPWRLAGVAGVLTLAAFLLSRRWLFVPAVWALALAMLGQTDTHGFLEWRPEAGLALIGVALGAAVLSALCQLGAVQRTLDAVASRLTPGLDGTWSEPLWVGGAGTLALLLLGRLVDSGPGSLEPAVAMGALVTSLMLMVARERWMANVATGLLAAALVATVSLPWIPVVVSGAGLVLCVGGMALDARGVRVGAALHHGGWVLALLSLAALRDLEHAGTPLCFLLGLGSAWTVVWRRPAREVVGWLASLVSLHGALMHLGAVYSSGRGSAFILPYFGAASAVLAALALFLASVKWRRIVGLGFTVIALAEVFASLSALGAHADALREALVVSAAFVVLLFALVRRAVREQDEIAAYLSQAVLALGYLSVRLLGMGAQPGTGDTLAALVGGALFTGLYLLVQREGSGLTVFRGPALWGAFLFPLAGLLSAPWHEPLTVAALLVGHAAHFAALASHPSRRGVASIASVLAFNLALLLVWHGTGEGEPQFYVIPAGLSLLALLRVFRTGLESAAYAQLRGVAVTLIYVAGAWKPLMFNDSLAMLLCVVLCVVGVAFGIALRIRSYVYLGTAFMVTCIAANLVRFGMRDHRIAAASFFVLGLIVIGSMVMFTAHRAALLQRYARVREMLSTWEG
ncbi:hypothetical protein NVS55_34390 [Myxococcus stipitatus]|uniref:hypothetical protein n=1 Tax=Myxococcus stipitatus TaxID=83455 RepID=UPI00314525EE